MPKNNKFFFLTLAYVFSVIFYTSSYLKAENSPIAYKSKTSVVKTLNPETSNCLSDESLMTASTLARCSENSALGDCWSYSNNVKLISIGAGAGVVAGSLKGLEARKKVRDSIYAVDTNPSTIMGAPNATNYESFLKDQLTKLQHSESIDRSEKKFQDQLNQATNKMNKASDKLSQHLKSIGLDEKSMMEKINFEKNRIALLKERALLDHKIQQIKIDQRKIQDPEWQELKKKFIANQQELESLDKKLRPLNKKIEATGKSSAKKAFVKGAIKGSLIGLLAGVGMERLKNHYTIKAIQRTYPGTSEEEASRLSSILIQEYGITANKPDDFSIAASTLDELLQHPQEERQQALQINPHLCQILEHQKKRFFEQASHYTNVQAKVLSCDHGQTRFLMNLGDGNYEAFIEKNKYGIPILTSTLMPGRLDQTNSRRTFTLAIDPKTGEFGSIRTEHIGAGSAFSNRTSLTGDAIIPIKDYTRIMAHGYCRWMDPTVEFGPHFVSKADQIGCNIARVTQAINYKFQEIMEACSSEVQGQQAPSAPATGSATK